LSRGTVAVQQEWRTGVRSIDGEATVAGQPEVVSVQSNDRPWMPAELFSLNSEAAYVGYTLKQDSKWITTPQRKRSINRIPKDRRN
jgi:hypothetical protein